MVKRTSESILVHQQRWYDEYDHKIHTKSLRLPQMLPDGTLYRSEIVPTVIAWLNGRILVGEGASQMKYQLKKGKNIWYSFKMELGEEQSITIVNCVR